MALKGSVGRIEWRTYTAAAVHRYTVTREEDGSDRLTGAVVEPNAFKLTQRPLFFVAPHQHGAWRWPIVAFTITDSQHITARLGAQDALVLPVIGPPKDLCLDL